MRRVAMLVSNDVRQDARVRREATALGSHDRVTVCGVDAGTPYGDGDSFRVRLLRPPAHRHWRPLPPFRANESGIERALDEIAEAGATVVLEGKDHPPQGR